MQYDACIHDDDDDDDTSSESDMAGKLRSLIRFPAR